MEFLIFLSAVVGAILVLYIEYKLAEQFYHAAYLKGYSERKYLWICFFFNIVGYLLVIALPDRNASSEKASFYDDELPEL